MTKNNLNEIIETTLNQHGMNAVVDVLMDMIDLEYYNGYSDGYHDGVRVGWKDAREEN